METRKHETYEVWHEEALYIESQDPKRPGRGFNDDPACFARYVEMQAKRAREYEFPKLADRMLATIAE